MHQWITGDSLTIMRAHKDDSVDLVIADPPYESPDLISAAIFEARRISRGATLCFMYLEDLSDLLYPPDRILVWLKPISTKNTTRNYSRFVEAIALYDHSGFAQQLYWANHTGVFTDQLIEKSEHPYKKPSSLIERLMLLHSNEGDLVFDPFAGSGTVKDVAMKLHRNSISVEIDPAWRQGNV